MKTKYAYFVRVYFNDGCRYVTSLPANNVLWQENEKPLAMTEKIAKETVLQLRCNDFSCEIVYDNIEHIPTQKRYINGRLDKTLEYYYKNKLNVKE